MELLASLVASLALYLAWAIVLSDNFFHRVWSFALSSLLVLIALAYYLPFSISTIFLIVIALLDAVFCVALSPVQIFFRHAKSLDPGYKALEILSPNENSSNESGDSQSTILAEFVLPLLSFDILVLTPSSFYYKHCCCTRSSLDT
jgi:hypothetical protein